MSESQLYNICAELKRIDLMLDECAGEISDKGVADALSEYLDKLQDGLESKVDEYCKLWRTLQLQGEMRAAEANRLAELSALDRRKAESLKSRLLEALRLAGVGKVKTEHFNVSVCKTGGKQPLEIYDPTLVPRHLCKHIPERFEPDGDAIRNALAADIDVPGAELKERGTHLRIS